MYSNPFQNPLIISWDHPDNTFAGFDYLVETMHRSMIDCNLRREKSNEIGLAEKVFLSIQFFILMYKAFVYLVRC